jgi:hypothetical protein
MAFAQLQVLPGHAVCYNNSLVNRLSTGTDQRYVPLAYSLSCSNQFINPTINPSGGRCRQPCPAGYVMQSNKALPEKRIRATRSGRLTLSLVVSPQLSHSFNAGTAYHRWETFVDHVAAAGHQHDRAWLSMLRRCGVTSMTHF